MATTANLGTLLRHYATKQQSAFVSLRDFCDYLRRYATHHIDEQEMLVQYLNISEEMLLMELEEYANRHEVYINTQYASKTIIVVITYYSVYFANQYKDILSTPQTPFPCITDLPKQLPPSAIDRRDSIELIPALLKEQDTKSPLLYSVVLPRDITPILFPACVPVKYLVRASINKIRHTLKKDEYHEYFLKKLKVANPAKEMTAKGFFETFLQHADNTDTTIDTSSEDFYFFNQICYFMRLDFEKVKDRTSEDTDILQAIAVAESYFMNKKDEATMSNKKQQALTELQGCLSKPPYFFSMDSILKFTDSKGAVLYGQYNEADLKGFMSKLTTESVNNDLPVLLVFKTDVGASYFIYKNKVFPLIMRLCNEAHTTVEKHLFDKWYQVMSNYEKLPEMNDNKAFEVALRKAVQDFSPVLYSLLNANFLPLLNFELQNSPDGNAFNVYTNGKLHSYSELLMLKNSSILGNVKMMLPFWYTFPIISWICRLFLKKPHASRPNNTSKTFSSTSESSVQITSDDIPDDLDAKPQKKQDKKDQMAQVAKDLTDELIPQGSTINRELDSYHNIWNKMITKDAREQLTEDVNSLIRDYLRKTIKTLPSSSFTMERVQNLATTLINTPNMKKIKEEDALYMYVQLYILKLVQNS